MKKANKIKPLKAIKEIIGANGIIILLIAALLLIAINIIQYKFAEKEINEDLRLRALSELSAKSVAIQNIMNEVEAAVRNHTEDVIRNLNEPDSMYSVAKSIVEQNSTITGSSISFIDSYYPHKGKWFEAYAVRNSKGEIETMQLGGENHDYFTSEFFREPIKTGRPVWTNPYLDKDGAKMMLTTYSVPVKDGNETIVGILDADISLEWIDDILTTEYAYPSSYHVLLSKTGQLMSVQDKNYTMKSIPDMARDYENPTFERLNEGMLSGESGETSITDKQGRKYRAFYMPVDEDTGWSIAIINSEKEIFGDFHKMKVTLLWLSIGGFVILLSVMARAIWNIKRLQKITIEREKIDSELNVAREIQLDMLPKYNLIKSGGEEIEVAGKLIPAKAVGGDIYDYFLKDHYLIFCIGDVSGKGVPASLFMTVTRTLFRTMSSPSKRAGEILDEINDSLCGLNESNMFVTLFLGILNLKTGNLNYSNAGHNAPLILDKYGVNEIKVIPNLPLGVLKKFEYRDQEMQLKKETFLLLYTDGVTEAMNKQKKEFGLERLEEDLKKFYSRNIEITPLEIIENLTEKIKAFTGNAEQSDDITLLTFRFKKMEHDEEEKISLIPDLESIPKLNKFVEIFCKRNELDDKFIMELKLAVEEAVVNVINHGYIENKNRDIEVCLKLRKDELLVEITDEGMPFDPTQNLTVDTSLGIEDRPLGGLGIFLIKQLTDRISYRRAGNFNILNFSKKLNS